MKFLASEHPDLVLLAEWNARVANPQCWFDLARQPEVPMIETAESMEKLMECLLLIAEVQNWLNGGANDTKSI